MKGKDFIDSYGRLPLGTYWRILQICKDEGRDDLSRQVGIVSLLSGLTEDEVLDLPLSDYSDMAGRSRFLETAPATDGRPRKSYRVDGWTLVPVVDARRMTAAQYIDFQSFAKQGAEGVPGLLSCLLVPEGRRYGDGYDPAEIQTAVRDHMSVEDALRLQAFFLASCRRSMADTLSCSVVRVLELRRPARVKAALLRRMWRMRQALRRNGAGSHGWTPSARHAGAAGMKSGGWRSWNSSISSATPGTRRRSGNGASNNGSGGTDGGTAQS